MKKKNAILTLMSLSLAFTGCGSNATNHASAGNNSTTTAQNETTVADSTSEISMTTETVTSGEITEAVAEAITEAATEVITEVATEVITEVATEVATEVTTEVTTTVTTESNTETEKELKWLDLAYYGIDDFGNISGIGYEYTYDSHGNVTSSTGEQIFTCENQYDGEYLTSVRKYKRDGSLDFEQRFKYADDGNCIEMDEYNENGILNYVYEYSYDNKGRKITESKVNHTEIGILFDFKYEYIYDEADNLVRYNWYSSDKEIGTYKIYSYDEQNNPTTVITYNADGSVFGTTMIYHDDANGTWVYEKYKSNTLSGIDYYNEDMDCIKKMGVDSSGQMYIESEVTYSYDEQGYKHAVITTSDRTIERVYMPFYR